MTVPKLRIGVQGGNGRVGTAITKTLGPYYDVFSADAINIVEPGLFAVINAAPFHTSGRLAAEAIKHGVHYLDLTEDVQVASNLAALAGGTKTMVIPQCGLAPGVVSIMAGSMARQYDKLRTLTLRVGGLPRFPTNMLGYALTWNVEGLVNQYSNPATAIRSGQRVTVAALDDVEGLMIDGCEYEAFNTSGGVGTLCDTYPNAVNIDYKTIRYPGHAKLIKFMMHELGCTSSEMVQLLERSVPVTEQDVVLIAVTSTGIKNGRLSQSTYSKQFFGVPGKSALQMVTAASVCAVLDMIANGVLEREGFVKQESIPLEAFIKNRFGKCFT